MLFKDIDIKQFTFEQKIEWILKQLFTCVSYTKMQTSRDWNEILNKYKISKSFYNYVNIDKLKIVGKSIEIPEKWNMRLDVQPKMITISGMHRVDKWKIYFNKEWEFYSDDQQFNYSFPPEQISEIMYRMKKES